ncbi:bifunctional hydroxymethylpyrimidine kinase/phosphomethylpyrimidine kinase [Citricoccus sp. I39-566]|uniref:bifunctional hydroxymethylpyrimidine kinase/phosphomethylpyrimidine kinase n=1 Tax=Citricoccus sp. I39-566 TaxID=3073268 RepID=UPI00286D475D|nr:bifunctional hydroxymethylpyrimidine kinase/phosphomethylpyrimidine kinase [Citricoccus sp. I39-566]WMY79109.1 bifunctional hydroxymethylpyrimidine kinase/phosphomethylpyrimidine kinase [Citricoccus sp. I39-566]
MLSIAGTDPSGGAGTAADLKSITAAGGYGMSVVTALVAQNTHGVRDLHVPPADFLAAQLHAVSDDVTLDAVKTGMLGTTEFIATVVAWLDDVRPAILVVDPVMIATSGDRLLQPEAEQAMVVFCRRATVVTPNIDELAVLTGSPRATTEDEALEQAARWSEETGVAVVVKTGHLDTLTVTNTWLSPDGSRIAVPSTRVDTTSTHGTGCSLSSALATRLGRGDSPADALAWATDWLHESITHGAALRVGSGHGPVDHGHRARRLQAAASSAPWIMPDAVPHLLETPADLGAPQAGDHGRNVTVPAPAVAPPGPWTAALWAAGAEITAAIADSDFVRALVDGSLPQHAFAFYLAQDALYLNGYARALAALAARSTDPDAQVYWSQAATGALTEEAELHRGWLGTAGHTATPAPGPVTAAYTNFLLATALGEDRAVGVAAVLPCFWLYAQVGAALPAVPADHRYADWLDTYRDPGFVTATEQALTQLEAEMAAASPAVRSAAARAYLTACRHELEFFDQALRIERGVAGAVSGTAGGTTRSTGNTSPANTAAAQLAGSAR